jgi:hypothetical protein
MFAALSPSNVYQRSSRKHRRGRRAWPRGVRSGRECRSLAGTAVSLVALTARRLREPGQRAQEASSWRPRTRGASSSGGAARQHPRGPRAKSKYRWPWATAEAPAVVAVVDGAIGRSVSGNCLFLHLCWM